MQARNSGFPHAGQELMITRAKDNKKIVGYEKGKPFENFNTMFSPSCGD
jgi:hypothetical protein